MVNLEPIKKKIQQRLLQKQRLLGSKNREIQSGVNQLTFNNSIPRLTYDKLATRTPFLRMTSGLEQPIILMGGELEDDGSVVSGYEDIYGPRRLDVYEDGELIGSGDTANSFKRPLPGVKSVEAQFQGGLKASRKATVNWSCWSFEDITRLTPHFLSHGKTVLLEWGWIYNQKSLQNIPSFIDATTGRISESAFEDKYVNSILESGGDFDMMIGIVKNFEYTTRSDGGFDCQTILSSVGVNLLKNPLVNRATSVSSATSTLDENEERLKLISKLKDASKDTAFGPDLSGANIGGQEEEKLLALDTDVTFKLLIENIDNYILNEIGKLDTKSQGQIKLKRSVASDLFQPGDEFGERGILIRNHDGILVPWHVRVVEDEGQWNLEFHSTNCLPSTRWHRPRHWRWVRRIWLNRIVIFRATGHRC